MGRREKRIRSEKEKTVFIRLERGEKGGGFERAERGERYDDELDKRKNRIDKMSRP